MKTADGLVEYCKAQLGLPYWWGTFGNMATLSLLEYKRKQYPDQYKATDFSTQIGKRVHDCVGLIKGYRWSESPTSEPKYVSAEDVSVSGLYLQCNKTGTIDKMPDAPGTCVFMNNMSHVGVYIGNGEVIEARGHVYGVVKTKLSERGWALWGQPKWMYYGVTNSVVSYTPFSRLSNTMKQSTEQLPTLIKGSYGAFVRILQVLLNKYDNANLDVDGQFGAVTKEAVIKWQRSQQDSYIIDVDGIVGKQTWATFMLK